MNTLNELDTEFFFYSNQHNEASTHNLESDTYDDETSASSSFCKTPTNSSSETACMFTLGVASAQNIIRENESSSALLTNYQSYPQQQSRSIYFTGEASSFDSNLNRHNLGNSFSHSMPQLATNSHAYNLSGQHHSMTSENMCHKDASMTYLNGAAYQNYQTYQTQLDSSGSSSYFPVLNDKNEQNSEGM